GPRAHLLQNDTGARLKENSLIYAEPYSKVNADEQMFTDIDPAVETKKQNPPPRLAPPPPSNAQRRPTSSSTSSLSPSASASNFFADWYDSVNAKSEQHTHGEARRVSTAAT